jgi:hypothetical protein
MIHNYLSPHTSTTMSKLSDYSKFDHLQDSDDDTDVLVAQQNQPPAAVVAKNRTAPTTGGANVVVPSQSPVITTPPPPSPAAAVHRRRSPTSNRFVFEYAGTAVYEWEQSLSEVVLYIPAPPAAAVGRDTIFCEIAPHHLRLGLQGAPHMFLDEPTFAAVDTAESTWCLEDDDVDDDENEKGNTVVKKDKKVIAIYLHKAAKGVVWETPLTGRVGGTAAETTATAQQQQPY